MKALTSPISISSVATPAVQSLMSPVRQAAFADCRWWLLVALLASTSWQGVAHAAPATRPQAGAAIKSPAGGNAPANAGQATPAVAPVFAPNGPFAVPQIMATNILILALDDLDRTMAALPASDNTPAGEIPDNLQPLPAIAPAGYATETPPGLHVKYFVLAKKQPKEPKVDKDADLFRLEPEPPSTPPYVSRSRKTDAKEDNNPAIVPVDPPSELAIPGGEGPNSTPEDVPFLLPGTVGEAAKPPGVAQAAAAPLRRALMRAGFADVLTTAPDGNALQRVVNNNRLSQRALDTVQTGMARLVSDTINAPTAEIPALEGAAPVPADAANRVSPAIQAAARIGQAMGYRAVLVMGVLPASATPGQPTAAAGSTYALLAVDALREEGDLIVFDENGAGELERHEAAGATGAALVSKNVQAWPEVTTTEKKTRVDGYMAQARAALTAQDFSTAQDYLNQVVSLDPNRAEAHLLLSDVLLQNNPDAAVVSMRRAASLNDKDGETWAKLAISYTTSTRPDWPRTLEAGKKALAAGYDSSGLRQAMATAQLGRAELFRAAGRIQSAEEAETDARRHLDVAMQLAPEDPGVTRLMTRQLVMQGRHREAVRALDRIALQYPDDVEIQTQYATSLLEVSNREEDAFVAWARVWKLSGTRAVPVDALRYRKMSNGFDMRLASLGKRAAQLAAGVAANGTSREAALLQMSRYKEDMDSAVDAIKVLQPGNDRQGGAVHASRVFAADALSQALENYALYMETGQEIYRNRANELHRQSITILNAARTSR